MERADLAENDPNVARTSWRAARLHANPHETHIVEDGTLSCGIDAWPRRGLTAAIAAERFHASCESQCSNSCCGPVALAEASGLRRTNPAPMLGNTRTIGPWSVSIVTTGIPGRPYESNS